MTCAIITDGSELKKFKRESSSFVQNIKKELRTCIFALRVMGCDSFCVNCEYGIPLWAAEIVCEMKRQESIKLHIVMPYEEQAAGWSEKLRRRYFDIHESCDSVRMVDTHYSDSSYAKAEDMLLKSCDMVLICCEKENELYAYGYGEKYGVNHSYLYL